MTPTICEILMSNELLQMYHNLNAYTYWNKQHMVFKHIHTIKINYLEHNEQNFKYKDVTGISI